MKFATILAPLALSATLAFVPVRHSTPSTRSTDTVVLVVRHAEKAGVSGDVPLSPAGESRAKALVAIARDAGVAGVITTQFQRTKQTGAPAAQSLGITPVVATAGGATAEHVKAIADTIRARFAGQTVLVVGHSNTVPAIVAALGGAQSPDLCDEEYDALFTVVVDASGKARVVKSRYGAPSVLSEKCAAMPK
ncbi:MAG: phosphoglycerate mutase family protein [Gemmatimonadaceae bacterium]